MHYDEIAPPAELARFVRCLWILEGEGTGSDADPVFPDGSPELIINFGDVFQARDTLGTLVDQPRTMLVGQITKPFVVRPTGTMKLVAARFFPFGATALCTDMSSITNVWLDISARFDPHVERRRSEGASSSLATIAGDIASQLAPILAAAPPHPHVEKACDAIRESRGTVGLEELAESLGSTLRTLQRRFAAQVGIPPKLLARITRFQHAFAAWREDPRTLARVAADCGYFDQSHLVRDFRDFAGEAPAAALAAQPEFTSLFLP